MERAEFESLVTRMEQIARERPAAYRRRVFGMAALGYGYLLLVVLVLLALTGLAVFSVTKLGFFGVKFAILFGALLFAVVRALWVRLELPKAEPVTRTEAPELFQLLDALQERLRTPPIHAVLLTPDLNAAVTQVPTFGLFGWHRNFLLLGLPLMKGLTVEQFKAVLAHELSHLSRGHARATNWIYRMRIIWARLEATFERRKQWGSGPIRRFFKWYIPYFNAMSFPFARANEFEADAGSVQLTSAREAAQALTAVHIIGSYLQQTYWPAIHAAAKDSPQPAFAPYSGFVAQAAQDVPETDLRRWHDAALSQPTSHADTHPSLADRLKAIGAPAEFAPPAPRAGADQLLGPSLDRIERTLDAAWRDGIAGSWRQFHEETQANRAQLVRLRADVEEAPLDEQSSLQLARLEELVGAGAAESLPMLRQTVERFPESRAARFALGVHLLRDGNEEGVSTVEDVLAQEPTAVLAGAQQLRDYFRQRGDRESSQRWHDRYLEEAKRVQAARQARQRLTLADTFLAHGLGPEAVSNLIAQLKKVPGIRRAYFVRKFEPLFPSEPVYVLGVGSTGFLRLQDRKRAADVVRSIQEAVTFPGGTLIISVEGRNFRFARKLRSVEGARII